MRKGYTDGGPWRGDQVRTGPALIRGYSESLRDVVLPVAHVRVRVEAERGRSGSGQGRTEAECGRGLPRGADEGEARGRRAGGESYHDNYALQMTHLQNCVMSWSLTAPRKVGVDSWWWRRLGRGKRNWVKGRWC